jgi:hypothetical protein
MPLTSPLKGFTRQQIGKAIKENKSEDLPTIMFFEAYGKMSREGFFMEKLSKTNALFQYRSQLPSFSDEGKYCILYYSLHIKMKAIETCIETGPFFSTILSNNPPFQPPIFPRN